VTGSRYREGKKQVSNTSLGQEKAVCRRFQGVSADLQSWTTSGKASQRSTSSAKSDDFRAKSAKQNAKPCLSFAEISLEAKGCGNRDADCKSAIHGSNPGGASAFPAAHLRAMKLGATRYPKSRHDSAIAILDVVNLSG
jgi:hypothetical protein